jgi:hypothetical protein
MAARMRPDISTHLLAVVAVREFPVLAGWLVKVLYQE